MTPTSFFTSILLAVAAIVAVIAGPQLYENVSMGKYHVTQSPFTGDITARMTPGPYAQWFSTVVEFPVSETFFFTADNEGGDGDAAVTVQFNDGSTCKISGTCRVDLPKDAKLAEELVTKHGYRNMDAIEDRLLLPTIRRSLLLTANQMSAKESYAEKRAAFISDAWDQITNGVYIMRDETGKQADPVTGREVTVTRKVPVVDSHGVRLREKNPLDGLGVVLSNFEVKSFIYEERVQKQIAQQQEALMAVQTAKATAVRAEQESLTVEKQGQAAVMKAKYEKEQEKIRAEVEAQKDASVAVIQAQKTVQVAEKEKERALVTASQQKEVASIELEAARLTKQRDIEIGTGEAERKRLVMEADGQLQPRLEAFVAVNKEWADAFSKRLVPGVVMGSSGVNDRDTVNFMDILGAKAARDLSLDLNIRGGPAASSVTGSVVKK